MSNDLDKSRIEVLRDATKDVSDTLRALDRKTSYIITLTSFLFTLYGFIVFKIENLGFLTFPDMGYFLPLIYLIAAVYFYFYSYTPILNPTDALQERDKNYSKNTFFILHTGDKENSIDDLAANYIIKALNIEGLAKVLYSEIIKLSKLRERRVSLIKTGNRLLLFGSIFCILEIITLLEATFWIFIMMIGAEMACLILRLSLRGLKK